MWQYNHLDPYELYHHGIKGQKWYVRRTEEELEKVRGNGIINENSFSKNPKNYNTLSLNYKEYAHVMNEIRTHITPEQKRHTIIRKPIGNYLYTFVNNYDGTYRVIEKEALTDSAGILFERLNDDE